MANSPTGAGPIKGWTAEEIFNVFKDLGLPVCDDDQLIRQKISDQQARFLRDRNSPDKSVQYRAEQWFRNVDALLNRRTDLLRIVYESFSRKADLDRWHQSSSGVTVVTQQTIDSLKQIARNDFRVDDKLADRFVVDFMKEKGLKVGGGIVPPPPQVENFTAHPGLNEINLKWDLPTRDCDHVEIIRELERGPSGAAPFSKGGELIFTGRKSSHRDSDVVAGVWYRYRICTFADSTRKSSAVTARAVAIAEVSRAEVFWKEGKICLSWGLPCRDVTVYVIRRLGSPPALKSGTSVPEASDPSCTEQFHLSNKTSYEELHIVEGADYYYRIIVDFGQGWFTPGVNLHISVPKPPPTVSSMSAVYRPTDDVVEISWSPLSSNNNFEYSIVRCIGGTAPTQPSDGDPIKTIKGAMWRDETVDAGQRYSYAVFTRSKGLYSRTGAASPPVDILSNVTGLKSTIGDGIIELSWTPPANVREVVVFRSLVPPTDRDPGESVRVTGVGHAHDASLLNGARYHYWVRCVYRPGGGTEMFSSGVRCSAVPVRPPKVVPLLKAKQDNRQIICTWDVADYQGEVAVICSDRPHNLPVGHRMDIDELDRLEKRTHAKRIVSEQHRGQAIDETPDTAHQYYSIFTITNPLVIAGGTTACCLSSDVTNLSLSPASNGICLQWVWPIGCTSVIVAHRTDDYPSGPADPRATCVQVAVNDYRSGGNKFVQIFKQRGHYHYIVYAEAAGATERFCSPGTTLGCRADIQWEPWKTVRYRLSPAIRADKGRELVLQWTIVAPFQNFGGFVLTANEKQVPVNVNDGIEIFRTDPQQSWEAGTYAEPVDLTEIRRAGWARFYCKAFVADSTQYHRTLFIHPNTCDAIAATGERLAVRELESVKHRFDVPKEVVCPRCFQAFPVGEMLFASPAGNEFKPGRYSWWHRLRRLPPQPPVVNGQRYYRKICPNPQCPDPILPSSAGAQASLVIGMIGAKSCGKSHYIASLINRLDGQVNPDFQANLTAVTDSTLSRYQVEFGTPLFRQHLPLPKTADKPAPLIYDLRMGGRLWGERRMRGVTLALYDTAGENFDSAAAVRQMVQYLRVARGLVFLIDPLQIRAVRDQIGATDVLPPLDSEADPNAILVRVLQELERGKIIANDGRLPVPVALVLTKCDVLRDANLIEINRIWRTGERHCGRFNDVIHEDMTGMIGEFLQRWHPDAFSTVQTRFSRHSFFGVSATGCASDRLDKRYPYVSPYRVEDPLLWLLAELGVIPRQQMPIVPIK